MQVYTQQGQVPYGLVSSPSAPCVQVVAPQATQSFPSAASYATTYAPVQQSAYAPVQLSAYAPVQQPGIYQKSRQLATSGGAGHSAAVTPVSGALPSQSSMRVSLMGTTGCGAGVQMPAPPYAPPQATSFPPQAAATASFQQAPQQQQPTAPPFPQPMSSATPAGNREESDIGVRRASKYALEVHGETREHGAAHAGANLYQRIQGNAAAGSSLYTDKKLENGANGNCVVS